MARLGEVHKQLLDVIQRSRVIDQQVKTIREMTMSRPMISLDMSINSNSPALRVALNSEPPDCDESTLLADTIYHQHCASVTASGMASTMAPEFTNASHLSHSVESRQADVTDFLVSMLQRVVHDANAVLRYAERVNQANELKDTIQPQAYTDPVPDYFSLVEQARQSGRSDCVAYNPIGRFIRYVYSLVDRNAALQQELQKYAKLYKVSY
ncbi:Hypothetical protein GLP15_3488 [Giardia lamblia P15]|uniref:Uncharacterized protein n=1 Tax=Giardia intestinalis (strain P15) TaxID=658858 RepID=E1F0F8_GIAIA|nr:Hypothetical protein GLP15_3488 [Giardia lamblia P15]